MRIAVLDLTEERADILSGLPRVAEQIINWLRPALPDADYTAVDVVNGAAMPDMDSFDGVIISGSEYGVYDDTVWMEDLRSFLLACREAGKAVFGICFGHQIMADVYGGKAELSPKGTVVGARIFESDGIRFRANVWHQDQVTQVPPAAKVSASADYCPIAALEYDFPALSIQFHPEYTQDHLNDIFDRSAGEFLSHAQIASARRSFAKGNVARDLMSASAAAFFIRNVGV